MYIYKSFKHIFLVCYYIWTANEMKKIPLTHLAYPRRMFVVDTDSLRTSKNIFADSHVHSTLRNPALECNFLTYTG